jgi:hypothetical protein
VESGLSSTDRTIDRGRPAGSSAPSIGNGLGRPYDSRLVRRAAVLLVFALTASSCAASLAGPGQPVAMEQLGGPLGLDVAAARETVLAFLDAYADAPADGVERLRSLVAGPDLRSWVRWLGVQNREFDGTIDGTVELRSAAFVASIPIKKAIGAQVDLGASVAFHFAPADAPAFDRTRILDGPVTLLRTGLGQWKIVDVTRDGSSMDAGITRLQGRPHVLGRVSVRLDSLFRFVPNWQFNVVVTNRTNGTVGLDPAASALVVRGAGGAQAVTTVPSVSLAAIPPGATVEGLIAVPYQQTARGRVLTLPFVSGDGTVRRFAFKLSGLIPQLPAPSTGAGSPSPASS